MIFEDISNVKFVSLKYLCQRFSSIEILKVVCTETNIVVPFKLPVGAELSVLIENEQTYHIFCDGDRYPVDDVTMADNPFQVVSS